MILVKGECAMGKGVYLFAYIACVYTYFDCVSELLASGSNMLKGSFCSICGTFSLFS